MPQFKLLIAMAIYAGPGVVQGATAMGHRTVKLGATKEEIVEALRVAYHAAEIELYSPLHWSNRAYSNKARHR